MRTLGRLIALVLAALVFGTAAWGQTKPCSCGASPPGVPANRTARPYANEPEDMRPFSRFSEPYFEHYTNLTEYNGAASAAAMPVLSDLTEIALGFLGPVRDHPDQALGRAMLAGAQMAVDEANARGGYCGKPFRLKVHNDAAVWGSASNELVRMVYDEKVWAMLGSISGDSTHIALRVSLRAELPMVNSASTDPTIPETGIPWILTSLQDDRVQCFTLARRIYSDLGLKRIGILRVNDRYGRFGVVKFKDASRRLGHPVVIEQKFLPGDDSFTRQLRVINDSRVDGILLWADAGAAGAILRQMHQMGMKQPVFGGFRVLGDELFRKAGEFAEGLEVVYPFDPGRDDPSWLSFQTRFQSAHEAKPDAFSALGFDTMNILLDAVCRAGLNRGRIRDALYGLERYRGVTGEMLFDPNAKNVAPLFLGKVQGGRVAFRRYTMEKPYAAVGGAGYAGPPLADASRPEPVVGLFGPDAEAVAAKLKHPGLRIVGVSSEAAWGKASTELVKIFQDTGTVAVIATDRASAHLAGQLSVKTFVPVLALSSDRTLTSTNIPWIFRLDRAALSDALECLADAVAQAGPNRGAVRDYLASGRPVAGRFAFESNGEPKWIDASRPPH